MFRSMRWRLSVPYIALIVIMMVVLVLYTSALVRNVYLDRMTGQMRAGARMVGEALKLALDQEPPPEVLNELAARYADILGARVSLVDAEGSILGESHGSIVGPIFRSEVRFALSQGFGSSVRYSTIDNYEALYVAVRVNAGDRPVGVVRLARSLAEIDGQIAQLRSALFLAGMVFALIVGASSVAIAERTVQPVRQLTRVAERLAEGDLNARLYIGTRDEVGQLADALNHMADELREKVTTLAREESQLSAILEGMADGVIMTDSDSHVRLINPAAARLLSTTQDQALGRSFAQVARQHQLIDLWQRCQEQGEEQSAAIEVARRGLFVQAIARPFLQEDASSCLVMLQDLTHVRRLETVRRDFISNISHELNTPLAGLKAIVDTLRDGALEDPPAARRFLDHMEAQVDALTQMVAELLELSRIESGRLPLRLSPTPVRDLVLPPLERLQPQIERAGLTLHVDLASDLPTVLAEKERVQQVVSNIVHNACKFTPEGGRILVSGSRFQVSSSGDIRPATLRAEPQGEALNLKPETPPAGDWVLISVRDTGIGIPADDLDRIFERFYKVDRARSGGGTGLGLSIAKHIVQGHGGQIWAESIEGQGSTLYFCLPAA